MTNGIRWYRITPSKIANHIYRSIVKRRVTTSLVVSVTVSTRLRRASRHPRKSMRSTFSASQIGSRTDYSIQRVEKNSLKKLSGIYFIKITSVFSEQGRSGFKRALSVIILCPWNDFATSFRYTLSSSRPWIWPSLRTQKTKNFPILFICWKILIKEDSGPFSSLSWNLWHSFLCLSLLGLKLIVQNNTEIVFANVPTT